MHGCGCYWLVTELQRMSRNRRLESLRCLWKRRSRCFAVYFKGVRMCLLGDGLVIQPERVDINRYVAGNGTVSFATKRNSNARNVPTANFNLWDTMTFTITSKVKIRMGAMWSVSMRYFRIIPAASYAATSMTRAVSMVMRKMLLPMFASAATGEYRHILNGLGRATEHMCGFFLTGQ